MPKHGTQSSGDGGERPDVLTAAFCAWMALFAQQVEKQTGANDKMDAIYLGLLSRFPNETERKVLGEVMSTRSDKAEADVVHALLNTGEFLFIR